MINRFFSLLQTLWLLTNLLIACSSSKVPSHRHLTVQLSTKLTLSSICQSRLPLSCSRSEKWRSWFSFIWSSLSPLLTTSLHPFKQPSHVKLMLANSCWQTQNWCVRTTQQHVGKLLATNRTCLYSRQLFRQLFRVGKLEFDVWTIGKCVLLSFNQSKYAL